METPESSCEKNRPDTFPKTVSIRGMTPAVEIDFADQLLPPVDKKERKVWERLQREKEDQQD